MVIVDINLNPRASFLTQSDWSAFFSEQLFCVRKEALGTGEQDSVGMHLRFQTQQEQTVINDNSLGKLLVRIKPRFNQEIKNQNLANLLVGI